MLFQNEYFVLAFVFLWSKGLFLLTTLVYVEVTWNWIFQEFSKFQ